MAVTTILDADRYRNDRISVAVWLCGRVAVNRQTAEIISNLTAKPPNCLSVAVWHNRSLEVLKSRSTKASSAFQSDVRNLSGPKFQNAYDRKEILAPEVENQITNKKISF